MQSSVSVAGRDGPTLSDMTDKVRASRDGDQYHYHWAARRCLELLPPSAELQIVTIEGASHEELDNSNDEIVDVGLYFGGRTTEDANRVQFIQLKHSTAEAAKPRTASDLKTTIEAFVSSYHDLREQYPDRPLSDWVSFEYTTNRPIAPEVSEALAWLRVANQSSPSGSAEYLLRYSGLEAAEASGFFSLFVVQGNDPNLWNQRNLLLGDLGSYLVGDTAGAYLQLKELVTLKATTDGFACNTIDRAQVLLALGCTVETLFPAPNLLSQPSRLIPREQSVEIRQRVREATHPIILYADGGVGKSVMALALAESVPAGSVSVTYDCFGRGEYRHERGERHPAEVFCTQVCNELAAKGLCTPLLRRYAAPARSFFKGLRVRLESALQQLRANCVGSQVWLIVDAADNAAIAASGFSSAQSFVPQLMDLPLPDGVQLVFTSRTQRVHMLGPSPDSEHIELRPFSAEESTQHLREQFADASETQGRSFAHLTSGNPRLQVAAFEREYSSAAKLIDALGPEPPTVEGALDEALDRAFAMALKHTTPAEQANIKRACGALVMMAPPVPIDLLSSVTGVEVGVIKSFLSDFGWSIRLEDGRIQLRDEPTETWLRERHSPDHQTRSELIAGVKRHCETSHYAAAALPALLVQQGLLDELVQLTLSGTGLPEGIGPVVRRQVELRRLRFALAECLRQQRWPEAAKLAWLAAAQASGDNVQRILLKRNSDLAGRLLGADTIRDVVLRSTLRDPGADGGEGRWYLAFNSVALTNCTQDEHARQHGHAALDALDAWLELPGSMRKESQPDLRDLAEIAVAALQTEGPESAGWVLSLVRRGNDKLTIGQLVGERLGRTKTRVVEALLHQLDSPLTALGISVSARQFVPDLAFLDRLLGELEQADTEDVSTALAILVAELLPRCVEHAVSEAVRWEGVLRRALPSVPPRSFCGPYSGGHLPLLRAYVAMAALNGENLRLADVEPLQIKSERTDRYSQSREVRAFDSRIGAVLPWVALGNAAVFNKETVDVVHALPDLVVTTNEFLQRADLWDRHRIVADVSHEWVRLAVNVPNVTDIITSAFEAWRESHADDAKLSAHALTKLVSTVNGSPVLAGLAMKWTTEADALLEMSEDDATSRADALATLARAIEPVNEAEARELLKHAIAIAADVGDDHLDQWRALLELARGAASHRQHPVEDPQAAQALSLMMERARELQGRDKHMGWEEAGTALAGLSPSSALAIVSRWRDRRFGSWDRTFVEVVYGLVDSGCVPNSTPALLAGIDYSWNRTADLRHSAVDAATANSAFRYLRLKPGLQKHAPLLGQLSATHGLDWSDSSREWPRPENRRRPRSPRSREFPSETVRQIRAAKSPDALERAWSASVRGPKYCDEAEFFRHVVDTFPPGEVPGLIAAVGRWNSFGASTLMNLYRCLPESPPPGRAITKALQSALLMTCTERPCSVFRHVWGSSEIYSHFHEAGIATHTETANAALRGFGAVAHDLDGGEILRAFEALADVLTADESLEALQFALKRLSPELTRTCLVKEEPQLRAADGALETIAGYVWVGLGSPIAAERWENAHVVRSWVEVGAEDLLRELVAFAEGRPIDAYVHSEYPFYTLHAVQWFLLGLRRGAESNPQALVGAAGFLDAEAQRPHVFIRQLAYECLRLLADDGKAEPGRFELPNVPIGFVQAELWELPDPETAAADVAQTSSGLGYTVDKHWLGPLAQAFGVREGYVAALVRESVTANVDGLVPAKDPRSALYSSHNRMSYDAQLPQVDELNAYRGYHGLAYAAAHLLSERPARRSPNSAHDAFQDWFVRRFVRRTDLWLSDWRDPSPVQPPSPPKSHDDPKWFERVSRPYLDSLLVTADGLLTVWGDWTTTTGNGFYQTVTIRSALVGSAGARALATALRESSRFDVHQLPPAGEELYGGMLRARGWIELTGADEGLDSLDPWAANLEGPGPAPSESVRTALDLRMSADGRVWSGTSATTMRRESWSTPGRASPDAEPLTGTRISGSETLLRGLLAEFTGETLVLGIQVRRWKSDKDFSHNRPAPAELYYLVGADFDPEIV